MAKGLPREKNRVIKSQGVRHDGQSVPVPVGRVRPSAEPAPEGQAPAEPKIHVDRAPDGTIERIRVECPCGRVTSLRCDYSEQEPGEQDEIANV